jgi:hypothetical protein
MTEEPAKLTKEDWHEKMAKDLFNMVWDLMDKADRTPEESEKMIHAAHASRFHWGEVGTPIHFERGEWQISRVYSVLDRAEPALHHARRCLAICEENDIGDFDIAFAHEAMARAYAVAGKASECSKHIQLAREKGELIEDEGNKKYFFSEIETISC